MTHVLTNHGYPHDLRFRSKSAEIFREHERRKEGIPRTEFDKIRSLSRQSWQRSWENPGDPLPTVKCNHFVTTYSTTHNYKALQEPTPCRPTSPTRRNNPHPTRSFLRLHLRQAKGFPKPKEKPGQDPCDVGYKPEEPNDKQQTMYYTLWEMKDREKRGMDKVLKATMTPNAVPAAQAWVRNAGMKDRKIVSKMLDVVHDTQNVDQTISSTFRPDIVPAVNRWLKKAGNEEQQAVMRLIRTLASNPVNDGTIDPEYTGQQHPDRYILGKYTVCQSGNKGKGIPITVKNHFPKKSHFKAHPAWLQAS